MEVMQLIGERAHLDGDIFISLSYYDPHWRWLKICIFKPIIHSPERVLHLLHSMFRPLIIPLSTLLM